MKEAINDWLGDRKNRPLEDIAKRCNVDATEFKKCASEIYTKCVEAAVSYHSSNGMLHSAAAREKGVDFLTYVMFRGRYKVHEEKGKEGLKHAEGLKRSELYKPEMPVSMELYADVNVATSNKKLSEDETQIVNALYNFYNGIISGDGKGLLSCCKAEKVNFDLVPKFMGQNKLGMTKDKAEAYQCIKILDELSKE
jgi:hypothetical protein